MNTRVLQSAGDLTDPWSRDDVYEHLLKSVRGNVDILHNVDVYVIPVTCHTVSQSKHIYSARVVKISPIPALSPINFFHPHAPDYHPIPIPVA